MTNSKQTLRPEMGDDSGGQQARRDERGDDDGTVKQMAIVTRSGSASVAAQGRWRALQNAASWCTAVHADTGAARPIRVSEWLSNTVYLHVLYTVNR